MEVLIAVSGKVRCVTTPIWALAWSNRSTTLDSKELRGRGIGNG